MMSPRTKQRTRPRAGVVLSLSLVFAPTGCNPPPSDVPAPDSGACPVATFDEGIPVQAVHVSMPSIFSFGFRVPPGPHGVTVDIEDSQGTVSFDGTGPMQAFIFNFSEWSEIQRTLYQGLAVKEGVWFPFWLYCTSDGKLDQVWAERTDRPGWTAVAVDGTCAPTSEIVTGAIDLPANTLRNVAMTCGFAATSTGRNGDVDLGSSRPGHMTYPGYSATILVFNTLDCRSGCGSRSFFELHALMWDRARNEVGFQIWYFDPLIAGVRTDNTITLPSVTSLNVGFPDATWQLGN